MDGYAGRNPFKAPHNVRLAAGILVIVWVALLVSQVAALLRGAPDSYHNEHWRGVTLSGGSLLLALSMIATAKRVKYPLMGLSAVTLAVSLWLIR